MTKQNLYLRQNLPFELEKTADTAETTDEGCDSEVTS